MMISSKSDEESDVVGELGWQDYLAIVVALAQSVLLPFLVIIFFLLVLFLASVFLL